MINNRVELNRKIEHRRSNLFSFLSIFEKNMWAHLCVMGHC